MEWWHACKHTQGSVLSSERWTLGFECVSVELRAQVSCSPASWLPVSGALLLMAHPHGKMVNWTLPLAWYLDGVASLQYREVSEIHQWFCSRATDERSYWKDAGDWFSAYEAGTNMVAWEQIDHVPHHLFTQRPCSNSTLMPRFKSELQTHGYANNFCLQLKGPGCRLQCFELRC